MSVRSSFRLTKGGWVFFLFCILLAAAAFNSSINMVYLVASLAISVLAAGVLMPLWGLRGVTCQRRLPEPAFAGEPFQVKLDVSNRARTERRFVRAGDSLCAGSHDAAGRAVLQLRGGESIAVDCRASSRPRGAYPNAPLWLGSRAPFGLAEMRREFSDSPDVLIYPARGRLQHALAAGLRPAGLRTGAPSDSGLPEQDFRSLRDYVRGDHPRRIHWRSSARQGKLLVREMERERSAPVMILLDSRSAPELSSEADASADKALELAVSFAAEVARVAWTEGAAVTLVGFFPEPKAVRAARDKSNGLGAVQEALARLRPAALDTADALMETAQENGLATAWRVIAVTPTRQSAEGLRGLLTAARARLFVADSPEFSSVFSLSIPDAGGRP